MLELPGDGCSLPAPPMPKGRRWTEAECELWRELWSSPQASQWDDSYAPVVGLFVRYTSAILAGKASAWMAQEARHLSDRLGLSPDGLRRQGWRIGNSPAAEPVPAESSIVTDIRARKAKLCAEQ